MSFKAVIVGVLAIICGIYFSEIGQFLRSIDRKIMKHLRTPTKPPKIWLPGDLVKFHHVAIFGHVFDVSSKPQFYGPNAHYSGFTGADTTRAFASSDLSEKAYISSVEGLLPIHFESALDWLKTFEEKYPFLGYINDLYFDAFGRPTPLFRRIKAKVEVYKKSMKAEHSLYPSCNAESHGDEHSVNCIENFEGEWYPRLISTPTQPEPRCACVRQNFLNTGRTVEFPGCAEFARECHYSSEQLEALLRKFRGRS